MGHLASMDCLFSLAQVAKESNYCRYDNETELLHRAVIVPAYSLVMSQLSSVKVRPLKGGLCHVFELIVMDNTMLPFSLQYPYRNWSFGY